MSVLETQELHDLSWRHLWRYRFAVRNLVLKDFRIRYRNMSLGILWSVLNPLVMLGVLVVIFSYIHPQRQTACFPIFLLLGLVPFNFFSLTLGPASGCIVDSASLIKKLTFPREIVPLASVLSQIIHLLIQLALLGLFLAIFAVPLSWHAVWLVPVYLSEILFLLGAAFFCSALNVYYRDTLYLVQSAITILFWFTPIFYALPMVKQNLPPALYHLYLCNPLAGAIDTSRRAILDHAGPDPLAFGLSCAVAVLALVVGWAFFQRMKGNFSDRI